METNYEKLFIGDTICLYSKPPTMNRKPYPIAKTNIKPCDNKDRFIELHELLIQYPVTVYYLNSGVSVKFKTDMIERNLFSLRHPKINNGNLYFNFTLNCVRESKNLHDLGIAYRFDFRKHSNFFNAPGVDIDSLVSVIDNNFMTILIGLAQKKQKKFKSLKNVV